METNFWFTDIFKGSGIQEMLEKIDTNIIVLTSPINIITEKNQYRSVDIEDLGFSCIRNSPSYTFVETKETDPLNLKIYNLGIFII